jgi:hypothetical protein
MAVHRPTTPRSLLEPPPLSSGFADAFLQVLTLVSKFVGRLTSLLQKLRKSKTDANQHGTSARKFLAWLWHHALWSLSPLCHYPQRALGLDILEMLSQIKTSFAFDEWSFQSASDVLLLTDCLHDPFLHIRAQTIAVCCDCSHFLGLILGLIFFFSFAKKRLYLGEICYQLTCVLI